MIIILFIAGVGYKENAISKDFDPIVHKLDYGLYESIISGNLWKKNIDAI